jgi:hypothetical protein
VLLKVKEMVRDTVHASFYGLISKPNPCKGFTKPQQEQKERDIDILNDLLLQGTPHVSQREPRLPVPYAPYSTSPPPQTPPPTPPPSAPPVPMGLPHTQNEKSYSETPQKVLPLQEVSGPRGSIHVHVPFTANDIQQCRGKLGKYTEDAGKFMIEFQILALGFDLS